MAYPSELRQRVIEKDADGLTQLEIAEVWYFLTKALPTPHWRNGMVGDSKAIDVFLEIHEAKSIFAGKHKSAQTCFRRQRAGDIEALVCYIKLDLHTRNQLLFLRIFPGETSPYGYSDKQ